MREDMPLNEPHVESTANRRTRKVKKRENKRRRVVRFLRNLVLSIVGGVVLFVVACYAIGFFTPWGKTQRLLLAETIISTRHYYLAHYITTSKEYAELNKQLHVKVVTATGNDVNITTTAAASTVTNPVDVIPISGSGYNGYVMLVHDPRLVRLVPAVVHGGMGEYITDMVKRVGAIDGTNASGFEDPSGNGWGGEPVGLEMAGGQVIHDSAPGDWTTVGFTTEGKMVMGQYSVSQLKAMGVRDAMQFHPELVVDGQPMITVGDGGWGAGPRTAIGQAKNGTVIFVVINGRFHGGSGMGATQKQVMQIMLNYGAVNACAMDGGSSTVLYHDGGIINAPSTIDPNGQRHLPDAWLVFSNDQEASSVQ